MAAPRLIDLQFPQTQSFTRVLLSVLGASAARVSPRDAASDDHPTVRGTPVHSPHMTQSTERDAPPTRHISTRSVVAVRGDTLEVRPDRVVGEAPLEIRAAGPDQDPVAVAVTMRTPGHEAELAVGGPRPGG